MGTYVDNGTDPDSGVYVGMLFVKVEYVDIIDIDCKCETFVVPIVDVEGVVVDWFTAELVDVPPRG